MDLEMVSKFRPAAAAICPHAEACPGCPLLDLSYADQLVHKFALVRDQLRAYPELAALALEQTEPAGQTLGYRTRAKLVVSARTVGLFARGTHDLIDTPQCKVLDPLLALTVRALRRLLPDRPLLAGVDLARAGESLLATLISAESADEADEQALRELASALIAAVPQLAGVAHTRRAADAVQLLAGGHTLLHGTAELRHVAVEGGPYHYVALGAFMQAHAQISSAIYRRLAQHVFTTAAAPRVLELYAGSGALSLGLAAAGAQVVAVESYAPACERLTRAAHEQQLSVVVRRGDAATELRELLLQGERFDVVLVNPPRRGLEPQARSRLASLAPAGVGYVSCQPSTLARDLAHLARLGLRCREARPFDMMPMTNQVETLTWLAPAEPPRAQVLFQNAGLVATIKAAHEPLVAEDGSPAHHSLVKQLAGFEAAQPLAVLAEDVSGIVLFARAAPEAEAQRGLLSEAQRTFSALVKGIVRARGRLRTGSAQVRYVRERVVAGHSLLRVDAPSDVSVRRAFRAIGHPILGDARADRASAKYFALRHGLDRPFLHLSRLVLAPALGAEVLEAPLSPDLCAVLRSVEAGGLAREQKMDASTDA